MSIFSVNQHLPSLMFSLIKEHGRLRGGPRLTDYRKGWVNLTKVCAPEPTADGLPGTAEQSNGVRLDAQNDEMYGETTRRQWL